MGNICRNGQQDEYSAEGTTNVSFSQMDESRHVAKNGDEQARLYEEIARLTRVNIESEEKTSELMEEIEKLKTELQAVRKETDSDDEQQVDDEDAQLTSESTLANTKCDRPTFEFAIADEDELSERNIEQWASEKDANYIEHKRLQDENEMLKSEMEQIKNEMEEQTKKAMLNEEAFAELTNTLEQVARERNDQTAEQKKHEAEIIKLKSELEQVTTKLDQKTSELRKSEENLSNLKNQLQKSVSQTEELRLTLQKLQNGRDVFKTKNEQNEGAKPKPSDSYLVNLSDDNRPDKVAVRFEELYNKEWTDCYEVLSSEEGVCRMLLGVCVNIYSTYVRTIESDTNKKNALVIADMLDDDLKGFLKVLRGGKISNAICLYWNKCMEICRQMIANDPPLYMDTDIDKHGHTFNDSLYHFYTERGTRIDYIVWPALNLMKNGKMLCKGHAQGAK
ncbi:cingulin-like isoform X2 [Dreissena polymorpha]|uniref:cingulin-like isoform X2 n=1 Tax=Dreissena polymorpha TaxID=45954 RepID=UPI002263CF64|nr:cingulin-like isoform X2 [Dreissena polymorpha]